MIDAVSWPEVMKQSLRDSLRSLTVDATYPKAIDVKNRSTVKNGPTIEDELAPFCKLLEWTCDQSKMGLTGLTRCRFANYENQCKASDDQDWYSYAEGYVEVVLNAAAHPGGNLLIPFEARRAGRRMLLRVIAREQREFGYTVWNPKHPVLIIGVVGEETMKAVSPGNLELCTEIVKGSSPASEQKVSVCGDNTSFPLGFGRLDAKVTVTDPLRSVLAILRGATLESKLPIERVVVMAQMPHTEAEELGAHLRSEIKNFHSDENLRLDLIVSEAQADHVSPNMRNSYREEKLIPVVTPSPAYGPELGGLVEPVSTVTLRQYSGFFTTTLENRAGGDSLNIPTGPSTLALLLDAMRSRVSAPECPIGQLDLLDPITQSKELENCRLRTMQYLLREMHGRFDSDVMMLERRDLFFNKLPKNYDTYEVCNERVWSNPVEEVTPKEECILRVALDRVLWKGDYTERVMVSGKDLTTMLKTAETLNSEEKSLEARDVSQQWLVTFGVEQPKLEDLTRLQSSTLTFTVAADVRCTKDDSPGATGTTYCVNGSPIVTDAAYWVSTSDHLASDSVIYKTMAALPESYHWSRGHFLTRDLTTSTLKSPKGTLEDQKEAEGEHQQRGIVHLDVGKLVAGFNAREPQGGDTFVANSFQGSTDSRASAPHQQELDLEGLSRVTADLPDKRYSGRMSPWSVGIQDDAEYDRSVQGNLTGKPENGNYPLNSFTVGGFLQRTLFLNRSKIEHSRKEIPRTLLVLGPYQYQRQMTGNYLFFPFSTGNNQFTIHAPAVNGFLDRAGLRYETSNQSKWLPFDRGSYLEGGGEISLQNNVLSTVTINGFSCNADVKTTLAACFKASGVIIGDGTTGSVITKTLHSAGGYWDMHLQKGFLKSMDPTVKGITLTIDSKGDYFAPRSKPGAVLSTQTLYAFPITVAMGFPILRNLTIGPTYSAFFYKSQLSGQSLIVNTVSVSARWYFARDTSVPIFRQLVYKGPASADQTKTSKIK